MFKIVLIDQKFTAHFIFRIQYYDDRLIAELICIIYARNSQNYQSLFNPSRWDGDRIAAKGKTTSHCTDIILLKNNTSNPNDF